MSERVVTMLLCQGCGARTYVMANGNCPKCGRFLTSIPGQHMGPFEPTADAKEGEEKS